MSNDIQIIRQVSRQKNIQQYIIEKDYALSYLMAAINATEGLGDSLVLKGGTALKKLYFPDYRFSEDLDYSTRMPGVISGIETRMDEAVRFFSKKLNERGPFRTFLEPLVLKHPHPGEQKAFLVRVQFPEQRQPLCRLKVEITVDEPILTAVETRTVLHDFTEPFDVSVPVYSLAEITAEKLRALLQSKARLQEKGWGASRVCRDYYDLWNLLRTPESELITIIPLLEQKCKVREVSFNSAQDFTSEELLIVARSEWSQQLLPFVPNAPPADEVIEQVCSLIQSLMGRVE